MFNHFFSGPFIKSTMMMKICFLPSYQNTTVTTRREKTFACAMMQLLCLNK